MSHPKRSASRRWRPAIGLVVASTILVAACGDDDDASAPTTSANAPTTSSATSSDTGVPANVATAQAAVAEATQTPTEASTEALNLPPITKPIPEGKTIDYITCGTPDCNEAIDKIRDAAAILGWNAEMINTDGTPQTVQNAWAQVLREKPDGVWISGFSRSMFNQEVLDAEAAGITVVSTGTVDPIGDGIVWVDGHVFYNNAGALMASWVLANSDGAPNVLYATIPDYPVVALIEDSFRQTLSEQAPNAKVETLTIPLEALGTTAPDLYVSALRSNPDIDFVVPAFDALWSGVPAALSAASLTDTKSITVTTTATGLQAIQDGQLSAGIGYDGTLEDFQVVDAFARVFAGEPVLGDVQYPKMIITTENLPAIEGHYTVLPGLDQYFSGVWGKS
jgi:ABC-type sugar transport system substrate-binding protein